VLRWLLLVALIAVLWRAARVLLAPARREALGGAARPGGAAERAGWDPWRVLGVRRGATREEVTSAYRDLLKRYHPDRVADLGEELQRVAHEKTLEIQRAYDELMR